MNESHEPASTELRRRETAGVTRVTGVCDRRHRNVVTV